MDMSKLSERERFSIIRSSEIDLEAYEYLKKQFQELKIEVCGEYEGSLVELMKKGILEGWCWETTETSVLFLGDEDYIERGYLRFAEYKRYFHSWICFRYNNVEYTFDPCLRIICNKDLYYNIFEIEVMGHVEAKEVKEEFINEIVKYSDTLKKEIIMPRENNINSPMYRNRTGYKAEIEDGKVKKLIAHYYMGF